MSHRRRSGKLEAVSGIDSFTLNKLETACRLGFEDLPPKARRLPSSAQQQCHDVRTGGNSFSYMLSRLSFPPRLAFPACSETVQHRFGICTLNISSRELQNSKAERRKSSEFNCCTSGFCDSSLGPEEFPRAGSDNSFRLYLSEAGVFDWTTFCPLPPRSGSTCTKSVRMHLLLLALCMLVFLAWRSCGHKQLSFSCREHSDAALTEGSEHDKVSVRSSTRIQGLRSHKFGQRELQIFALSVAQAFLVEQCSVRITSTMRPGTGFLSSFSEAVFSNEVEVFYELLLPKRDLAVHSQKLHDVVQLDRLKLLLKRNGLVFSQLKTQHLIRK
uniref:Uncharacterized protein n=1 Tax=Tetraselmis sp. GSL018 TaxID=582737 RepID=A0A061QHU1_9CHLO|mmetsp:Transcript_20406/g.48577  ORF Transcript_20406/g.48577 Transcript_20406/m.48577 type:complete len:329 (-) Transcript_20406:1470-2456(-)